MGDSPGNIGMSYYALLFIAGVAGSFHCIGMCGGFACGLGGDPRGRGGLGRWPDRMSDRVSIGANLQPRSLGREGR